MALENNEQKKCGFCGESIPARAGRCPYCGSLLEVAFENSYQINPDEDPVSNEYDSKDPGMSDSPNSDDAGQNAQAGQIQAGQSAQANPDAFPPQDGAGQYANTATDKPSTLQGGVGQQQEQKNSMPGSNRENYNNRYIPDRNFSNKYGYTPLSNGLKVFLTALFIIIPGIGQLAGIITAIVFMNSEGDSDRKSFGVALLVLSLIIFVFACIGCFVAAIFASSANQYTF